MTKYRQEIRELAKKETKWMHEPFTELEKKTNEFIKSYKRGYFPQTEKKRELREKWGLNQNGLIHKRWQKKGEKLSRADVLSILHQVFVIKETYASIAAKWGITTAYVS